VTYEFNFRRGMSGTWAARNSILGPGEPGLETDTGKIKIGDGQTSWVNLPYFVDEEIISEMIAAAELQGPPGDDGEDGADGAPGLSAYQIAVANGFVGNQTQWLASLVGPPGANGTDGTNGSDGEDGQDGVDGTDGVDGESVTVTLVPAANWPPASDSNPLHLYFRVP